MEGLGWPRMETTVSVHSSRRDSLSASLGEVKKEVGTKKTVS